MIELLFSTADTDLATGRAAVLASLDARAKAVGLGSFFPVGQQFPGRAPDVPTSALSALLTAPQRAALAGDFVVINVSDGLLTEPGDPDKDGNPTNTVTGYRMDLLIALHRNDALVGGLMGILSGPWAVRMATQRDRSAKELELDPGAPAKVAYKQDDTGVRMHHVPPRVRKHSFAGAP